jgi:hypothetical protein
MPADGRWDLTRRLKGLLQRKQFLEAKNELTIE